MANILDYAVLGGGWTGVLIAKSIKQKHPNASVSIIEAASKENLGGLLNSVVVDGFTYDTGGPHMLFSKNDGTLKQILRLLGETARRGERHNFVRFRNDFIPYPFENGMYKLDSRTRVKIGKGIIDNMLRMKGDPSWAPKDFSEWVYGFFGEEMANTYLLPYNKKVWKRDLKDIDADWVFSPGRLPFPNLNDILLSIAGCPSIGYKEQYHFYYPKTGGIKSLYNAALNEAELLGASMITNFKVTEIKKDSGTWLINGKLRAKNIISTIPIPYLVTSLDAPEDIKKLADGLDYNRVVVCGLALDLKAPDQHAIFVPDERIPFHRYTWMSNLTTNTPKDKSNLIVETTVQKGKHYSSEEILAKSIKGLIEIGAIKDEKQIMHARYWVNEFGYPIYTKGHNEVRRKIFDYLKSVGITSIGRWGSWHYWNSDKVLDAVIEMDRML